MKKAIFSVVVLGVLTTILIFINFDKNDAKVQVNMEEKVEKNIYVETLTLSEMYETIRQDNFWDEIHFYDEEELNNLLEEIKGDYNEVVITGEENSFPEQLILSCTKVLYESNDGILKYQENNQYEMLLQTYGAEECDMEIEDYFEHFPEMSEYKEQIDSYYDIYKYMDELYNIPVLCYNMFYLEEKQGERTYVFQCESGGTNGVVEVYIITYADGEFHFDYEHYYEYGHYFETQGDCQGSIIKYGEDYYYIYLYRNDNLKIYDGIKLHRLGKNAKEDTLLIRYVPEKFHWRTTYRNEDIIWQEELNSYMESIKDTLLSEKYMEIGPSRDISVYYGVEEEMEKGEFSHDRWYSYFKVDMMNTGIPVYFSKYNLIPSTSRDKWTIRAQFYLRDEERHVLMELQSLEVNEMFYDFHDVRIVQLWFQEIDNKIVMFCVSHISDYNYALNVILLEGSNATQIRTDIFAPQRKFEITEGHVFSSM